MRATITVKENVTKRLDLLDDNIANGAVNAVTGVLVKSVATMQQRVKDATTETGARRAAGLDPLFRPRPAWFAGRGPGRIESGRLYNALGWTFNQQAHSVSARAGFINRPPGYLAAQEPGTQRSGRSGRGIPPMLAFAKGKTVAAAMLAPTMQSELAKAVRAASSGRTWKRKI